MCLFSFRKWLLSAGSPCLPRLLVIKLGQSVDTRQNIGQILRANGMKRYDEYALLVKNQGRCCQDEFYLEEIQ